MPRWPVDHRAPAVKPPEQRDHLRQIGPRVRGLRGILRSDIEAGRITRDEADREMLDRFGLLMEITRSKRRIRERKAELGVP
jgi:hypothetical protein